MGKDKPEMSRKTYMTLEIRSIRVIEVEVTVEIPDKLFKLLKEAGKLDLIQEWFEMSLRSMAETIYLGDLLE